jgi:hypothetical protein
MFNPGDLLSTIGDYLWIINAFLIGGFILGLTGTIVAYVRWLKSGIKTLFSPEGMIVFTIIMIAFGVIAILFNIWWTNLGLT